MDRKICSSASQHTRDADGQEKWYTKVPRKMNNVKKMMYAQDGLAGKMENPGRLTFPDSLLILDIQGQSGYVLL